MSAPSKRPRDSQRAKVYAAERAAFGATLHEGTLTRLGVEAMVEHLTERFGLPPVHVRHRTSGRRSWGGLNKAKLPYIGLTPCNRNPMMVAHELAHAWLIAETGTIYAAHGPQWCRVYLMLLEEVSGTAAATDLESMFTHLGVDHSSGINDRMDSGRWAA